MIFLLTNNIKNFKRHSQFKSLKDFNNNIEQWMIEYKHQFTTSELIALKRLIRYSAKVPGISNAKINTILNAINEKANGYGVSRSTFKRMISKAKKIGLLEVKETVRSNQSQSSNLYIFQRFNTIEPPQTEGEQVEVPAEQQKIFLQLNHHNKLTKLIKTYNIKTTSEEIDHTYLPSFIDSSFIDTAKPFFNAEEIYKLWLRVLIAYKKSNVNRSLPEVIGAVNKALKETVFIYKQDKIKSSFEGYFYRLVENYLGIEKRRENKHLLYNWLEA
jgi:hypothetical protein